MAKSAPRKPSAGQRQASPEQEAPARPEEPTPARFTYRQGQFLAFIHLYRRMHRRSPSEGDMMKFFGVTPPTVHGMVLKLEELGLITREPGAPRSIEVVVPEAEIPQLDPVPGRAW
jgi:DNA-binding MarR family transcriptional regulator